MEHQQTVQQEPQRRWAHIYEMKQEWKRILEEWEQKRQFEDLGFVRIQLTPFQVAYYAMRKQVPLQVAMDKLFKQGKRGLYKDSPFWANKVQSRAGEIFHKYAKPTVNYPA